MKSNLLKSILLCLLIIITVLSFGYGPHTKVLTPRPSGVPVPVPVFVEQPPPVRPATEWAEGWESYTYAGEEFSVEMPGMPFEYESSRSVGASGETEPMRTFGLYSDGLVLLITSFDNPRAEEKSNSFAAYHWQENEFTYLSDVKSGLFWGEEYLSTGAYLTRARVFRARNHAYLVCAMSQNPKDPRIEHFLESFTLGGRHEGVEIYEPPQPAPASHAESATPGRGGGPYESSDVMLKAIVAFKPPSGYTEEARLNEVTGMVRLRAVLAADGKVGNVSVIGGLPHGLTEKAVNSARHILFFPAIKDDRTVSQYVTLEYNFNIY
ncbi:MAG TPA: energy transducer TonB [Pyrinomonadaceae bacterium]|jgi:TonB family protein|nr:energy transducer TonB [Pyrinomonadaceae bacterium]